MSSPWPCSCDATFYNMPCDNTAKTARTLKYPLTSSIQACLFAPYVVLCSSAWFCQASRIKKIQFYLCYAWSIVPHEFGDVISWAMSMSREYVNMSYKWERVWAWKNIFESIIHVRGFVLWYMLLTWKIIFPFHWPFHMAFHEFKLHELKWLQCVWCPI